MVEDLGICHSGGEQHKFTRSRFWNQFQVVFHYVSFSHVFLASLVKFLSRFDLYAVIMAGMSVVSCSFIALFVLDK